MNYRDFIQAGADAFIGTVEAAGGTPRTWIVTPQIIEHDGSTHKPVLCYAAAGIALAPGNLVLILTMRNNLNFAPIQRIYEASEANGVIIGLVGTDSFALTGSFSFSGDVSISGNLAVSGNLTVGGNANVTGDAEIDGTLTLAGTDINAFVTGHMHESGTLVAPSGGGPVTGQTGAPA